MSKLIFNHQEADQLVRKMSDEAAMPILDYYKSARHGELVWNMTNDPNGLRWVLCEDGTVHLTGMVDNCPYADGNNVCKVTHDGNILLGYLRWIARRVQA
jgi:hypothetical protein